MTELSDLERLPFELLALIFETVCQIEETVIHPIERLRDKGSAKKAVQLLLAPLHISRTIRAFAWNHPPIWRLIAGQVSIGPFNQEGYHSLLQLCAERTNNTLDAVQLAIVPASSWCCRPLLRIFDLIKACQTSLKSLRILPRHSMQTCVCPQCQLLKPQHQAATTTSSHDANSVNIESQAAEHVLQSSQSHAVTVPDCCCSLCSEHAVTWASCILTVWKETIGLQVMQLHLDITEIPFAEVWQSLAGAAKPSILRFGAFPQYDVSQQAVDVCSSLASQVKTLALHSYWYDREQWRYSQRQAPSSRLYQSVIQSSASNLIHLEMQIMTAHFPTSAFRSTSFPVLETLLVGFMDDRPSRLGSSVLICSQMPSLQSFQAPTAFLDLVAAPSVTTVGVVLQDRSDDEEVTAALSEWSQLETLILYIDTSADDSFSDNQYTGYDSDGIKPDHLLVNAAVRPILDFLVPRKRMVELPCPHLRALGIYNQEPSWRRVYSTDMQQLPNTWNWREPHLGSCVFSNGWAELDGTLALLVEERVRLSKGWHPRLVCVAIEEVRTIGFRIQRYPLRALRQVPPPFIFAYQAVFRGYGSSSLETDASLVSSDETEDSSSDLSDLSDSVSDLEAERVDEEAQLAPLQATNSSSGLEEVY